MTSRILPDGSQYVGSLDGNDGPLSGVATSPDGTSYRGTYLNSQRHGQGSLTYRSGDSYDCNFVFGHLVGKGKCVLQREFNFTGIFGRRLRAGEPDPHEHVTNTLAFRNVETAKGWAPVILANEPAYERGLPEYLVLCTGEGTVTYGDGRVFEGVFEHGRPTYRGKMTIPCAKGSSDADLYVGQYSSLGQPEGDGKLACHNGDVFTGTFSLGWPTGWCRARYTNGDVYEGNMAEGLRDGRGRLRMAGGDVYEGEFDQGQITGEGRFIYADGSTFEGTFVNGVRQGRGRLTSQEGCVFDGSWYANERCGRGISVSPNGERQEAWYASDKLAGTPRIFFALYPQYPQLLIRRTSGASLRSFFAESDRPVRLELRLMPSWFIALRHRPPSATAAATVRVYLDVVTFTLEELRDDRSRTILPDGHLDARSGAPPFHHACARIAKARVQLVTQRPDEVPLAGGSAQPESRGAAWLGIGAGVTLRVAPLLEWSRTPVPHTPSAAVEVS